MLSYANVPIWKNINEEKWSDWRWQLSNPITTLEELQQIVNLSPEQQEGIVKATKHLKMRISPHLASMMIQNDPSDTFRTQFIPNACEVDSLEDLDLFEDVNADERYSPVQGLVHRYPSKVLIFPSNYCGAYCRYCFRRKLNRNKETFLTSKELEPIFQYIEQNSQIEEVILSGGDPLVLDDNKLVEIFSRLALISHIKITRIHTRMPVTIPYRITDNLVLALSEYKKRFPIYFVLHIDSIAEISNQTKAAVTRLTDAGFPCLASCPLLRGVNDDETKLRALWTELVTLRVKPYYLFHSDPVAGLRHFLVPIERGLQIMQNLYDNMSGLAMPLYCFNVPDGGGHVLLTHSYVSKINTGIYKITNFEGNVIEYREPAEIV